MFDEFDLQKYKEKKTKSIIITITIIEPADIIRRYNIILLLLCMYTIGAIISYSTDVDRALRTSVLTPVQRGTNRLLGTHNDVQYTQVLCLHRISLLYYLVFYYCCYFISLFARPPVHYYVAVYIYIIHTSIIIITLQHRSTCVLRTYV